MVAILPFLLTMIPTCINASSTIQTTSKPFRQPITTTFIFDKIQRDFNALTRRVTAYHILLPSTGAPTKVIDDSGIESSSLQLYDTALTLKQKIRNKALDQMYVVDAFNEAARRYSIDKETAVRGGLLGTLGMFIMFECDDDSAFFTCFIFEYIECGYYLIIS